MTDAELLALIKGDATATGLANQRRDGECRARLAEIVPPVPVAERYFNERTLFAAFADPADAEAILQGLATIGQSNPVVNRVRTWLVPSQGGVDLGNAVVRAVIQQLASDPNTSAIFNSSRVAVLLALGESKPAITTDDVSRVLATAMADGKTL